MHGHTARLFRSCLEGGVRMTWAAVCLVLGIAASAVAAGQETPADPAGGLVIQIEIDGPIGPATAGFVAESVEEAGAREADLLLIRLDTPGGLDLATRDIVRDILNSPVPVATYVAPAGARAASAGTYILLASHVAAMSPATNVGAATPVAMIGGSPPGGGPPDNAPDNARGREGAERGSAGQAEESAEPGEAGELEVEAEGDQAEAEEGAAEENGPGKTGAGEGARDGDGAAAQDAMTRKVINDSVAYIRGLAERHGRNADWAERAVREGVSVTADEALELEVIDLLADDIDDLLAQIDGRPVTVAGAEQVLNTAAARVEIRQPDWKTEFLGVITSPTIAYVLLLIGIYGLILEGYNPGAILPGVVGAICLLLALYALQMLPVNYVGFGLIVLGVILMIAEAFAPSFGVLGFGGIVALVIGSIILIDTDAPGFVVSRPLIGAIALAAGVGLMAIVGFAVKARQRPVVSGSEELIGVRGEVLEASAGEGYVFVHGERWHAVSDAALQAGDPVTVRAVHGLTLEVEPVTDSGSGLHDSEESHDI